MELHMNIRELEVLKDHELIELNALLLSENKAESIETINGRLKMFNSEIDKYENQKDYTYLYLVEMTYRYYRVKELLTL